MKIKWPHLYNNYFYLKFKINNIASNTYGDKLFEYSWVELECEIFEARLLARNTSFSN